MSKYLTEDGDEVEAFTEVEITAKIEEAKKSVEEDFASKLKEKEDAIVELNKKIEGADDKSKNFANLREAKDALEKTVSTIKDEMNQKISDLETKLSSSELKKEILSKANGNKELAEKIELHYNGFQKPKAGEEDKRLDNAVLLATGGKVSVRPGSFSSGLGISPGSKAGINSEKLSEDAVELGRQFGLSEEELTGKKK